MTVPSGLLVDLAHERQVELRRRVRGADQRALIRSSRRRTLTAGTSRRLTLREVAVTIRRRGISFHVAEPSLTTAKEQS